MLFKKDCLIACSMVLVATCQALTLKKDIHKQWEGSTSPTITVQRHGGSTYYDYLKVDPPTTTVASSFSGEETQTLSPPESSSATRRASVYQYRESGSASANDESEIEEEHLSGGNEEDVQVVETTATPTDDGDDVGEDEQQTEKLPVASISDSNSDSVGADGVPSAGDTVDSPDESNGPSDQKPVPPAEAVPGQPGEDDPDSSSSSSSSSEESSSSSSEEYRQAYKQKVWEQSKLKSSKDTLLLARLHNKLVGKKDKANKYTF